MDPRQVETDQKTRGLDHKESLEHLSVSRPHIVYIRSTVRHKPDVLGTTYSGGTGGLRVSDLPSVHTCVRQRYVTQLTRCLSYIVRGSRPSYPVIGPETRSPLLQSFSKSVHHY